MIRAIIARMFPEPLPVLKAMPPHVANLAINLGALELHMMGAHKPRHETDNRMYISPKAAQ